MNKVTIWISSQGVHVGTVGTVGTVVKITNNHLHQDPVAVSCRPCRLVLCWSSPSEHGILGVPSGVIKRGWLGTI